MTDSPLRERLINSKFMVFAIYAFIYTMAFRTYGMFFYMNIAVVDGLAEGRALTDVARAAIGLLLTGFDVLICLAFVSLLIHLARRGDRANVTVIQWIRQYRWFAVYGLVRWALFAYFLVMQYAGTFLSSEGYKGWSPLVGAVMLSTYFAVTWWLSQREPEDLKRRGKLFLGPRAAHLLDK